MLAFEAIRRQATTVADEQPREPVRLHRLIIVGACAVATLIVATASVAAPRDRCVVEGGRVIARAGDTRVWKFSETISACRAGQRPRYVGERTKDGPETADAYDVRHLRVAGRFVAWENTCTCREPRSDIMRLDLRGSKRRVLAPVVASGRLSPARDIVLRRDGALAWVSVDIFEDPRSRQVWKSDGAGVSQLDSGQISKTLDLRSGRVHWRKAGRERSSALR